MEKELEHEKLRVEALNTLIDIAEKGNPLENPIAERVNGILKGEWLNYMELMSKQDTEKQLRTIISTYNTERPRSSINMLIPKAAHNQTGEIERRWKNYYRSKK